jgi:lipid A disaccharide synthetase
MDPPSAGAAQSSPSAPAHAPRIFISVAEQSADEHAAALVRAFHQRQPDARFVGLTGPALRAAGCETFHDMTARSAMALAAIRRVPEALRLLWRLRQLFAAAATGEGGCAAAERFDAAVLVDSPTLNLPIARLCRRAGIPVLYYIAPQTWAWAAWRNKRIRRRVNRLACIWPFEEGYFRQHGILATYVGHPSFDHLLGLRIDDAKVAALRAAGTPVITLLPGSRAHVVREVFPGQLEAFARLKKKFVHARGLVVPANYEMRCLIGAILAESPHAKGVEVITDVDDEAASSRAGPSSGLPFGGPIEHKQVGVTGVTSPTAVGVAGAQVLQTLARQEPRPPGAARPEGRGSSADRLAELRATAIRAADVVFVASGTVTLEVAYHAVPMIVMYNASRWLYKLIGRRLIRTPFLSIPNILAGRRIVPELMPYYRTVDPVIAAANEWLSTPATLARIRQELADLIRPIIKPGAADNAAAELAALLPARR